MDTCDYYQLQSAVLRTVGVSQGLCLMLLPQTELFVFPKAYNMPQCYRMADAILAQYNWDHLRKLYVNYVSSKKWSAKMYMALVLPVTNVERPKANLLTRYDSGLDLSYDLQCLLSYAIECARTESILEYDDYTVNPFDIGMTALRQSIFESLSRDLPIFSCLGENTISTRQRIKHKIESAIVRMLK